MKRFVFLFILFFTAACTVETNQSEQINEPTAIPNTRAVAATGEPATLAAPEVEVVEATSTESAPIVESEPTVAPEPADTAVPTEDPTGDGADSGVVSEAAIERFEVSLTLGEPPLVSVTIFGNLPNGCATLGDVKQAINGDTVVLTVEAVTPADQICTQALVPFEQSVDLDLATLPSGTYNLLVNNATGSFEYDAGGGNAGISSITDITIEGANGLQMAATFYPGHGDGPRPAVLLLHMLNSNRQVWVDFAAQLNEAGYSALALDMRGHGETGGSNDWELAREDMKLAWA